MHTPPIDEDLLRKWRKQGTPSLLRRLENPNRLDPEDLAAIKGVLRQRDKLREDLTAATKETDIDDLLLQNGLNWTIELRPLCAELTLGQENYVTHDRLFWPVRLDIGKMLGRNACDGDKPIIQNKELVDLGLRLARATNATLAKVFIINDGASIMLAIESPAPISLGVDMVKRFVYLLDNRTSEHGLRIGFGDTVLRCSNQLRLVKTDAAVKMKHTKTMKDRIEGLVEAYDGLAEQMDHHDRLMRQWSGQVLRDPVWSSAKYDLIRHLTGVDLREPLKDLKRQPPKVYLAQELEACIADQVGEVGQTPWGLLQGVTLLTTHKRHHLYPVAEVPDEDKDLVYGKAGALNSEAYAWLSRQFPLKQPEE